MTVAWITGFGTVMLKIQGEKEEYMVCLSPVHYIPNLTGRLLSLGMFLKDGMKVTGDASSIVLLTNKNQRWIEFKPRMPGDTIYQIKSRPIANIVNNNTMIKGETIEIFKVDYQTMHRRLGHPKFQVILRHHQHLQSFVLPFLQSPFRFQP